MEKNFTTRTGLIIGDEGINKLKNSNVIVKVILIFLVNLSDILKLFLAKFYSIL